MTTPMEGVAAVVGQNTLVSWGISPSTLHLAGGVVLPLVALRTVLEQYEANRGCAGCHRFPEHCALPLTSENG